MYVVTIGDFTAADGMSGSGSGTPLDGTRPRSFTERFAAALALVVSLGLGAVVLLGGMLLALVAIGLAPFAAAALWLGARVSRAGHKRRRSPAAPEDGAAGAPSSPTVGVVGR